MTGGACFSACGTFRYHLWRQWGPGARLAFCMLNPSTANGETNDPTVTRCVGFARSLGYAGIDVVNLFAYRATKPADLKAVRPLVRAIGPENDDWIRQVAHQTVGTGGEFVCAWGAHARGLNRALDVLLDLRLAGVRPMCLAKTADGVPRHPLMLPASCRLKPL